MEKTLLIGLNLAGGDRREVENSLSELARLCETAGGKPVEKIIQNRQAIDPGFLIGSGKVEEIKAVLSEKNINTVIFDEELKPVQQKNLEEALDVKIIDRTRLILDIFAKRARSKEGILQVERAQLEYYLPRLTKRGISLDSQTGGIGTRPGQKKLEVDQRRIRDRIALLDREIDNLKKHRNILRQKRVESGQTTVAIVGYTNAGKSTLLNAISEDGNKVYADDKLFATLDPTTRKVKLTHGRVVLFTDTVGFIRKLPHTLVAAFRATLEEVTNANCLLHVIDASSPDYKWQIDTVLNVLKELGADSIPIIPVYNKADLLTKTQLKKLKSHNELLISAIDGFGKDKLFNKIEGIITPKLYSHNITLPYTQGNSVNKLFKLAVINKQTYTDKGIKINLKSTREDWQKIKSL